MHLSSLLTFSLLGSGVLAGPYGWAEKRSTANVEDAMNTINAAVIKLQDAIKAINTPNGPGAIAASISAVTKEVNMANGVVNADNSKIIVKTLQPTAVKFITNLRSTLQTLDATGPVLIKANVATAVSKELADFKTAITAFEAAIGKAVDDQTALPMIQQQFTIVTQDTDKIITDLKQGNGAYTSAPGSPAPAIIAPAVNGNGGNSNVAPKTPAVVPAVVPIASNPNGGNTNVAPKTPVVSGAPNGGNTNAAPVPAVVPATNNPNGGNTNVAPKTPVVSGAPNGGNTNAAPVPAVVPATNNPKAVQGQTPAQPNNGKTQGNGGNGKTQSNDNNGKTPNQPQHGSPQGQQSPALCPCALQGQQQQGQSQAQNQPLIPSAPKATKDPKKPQHTHTPKSQPDNQKPAASCNGGAVVPAVPVAGAPHSPVPVGSNGGNTAASAGPVVPIISPKPKQPAVESPAPSAVPYSVPAVVQGGNIAASAAPAVPIVVALPKPAAPVPSPSSAATAAVYSAPAVAPPAQVAASSTAPSPVVASIAVAASVVPVVDSKDRAVAW